MDTIVIEDTRTAQQSLGCFVTIAKFTLVSLVLFIFILGLVIGAFIVSILS